MPLATQAPKKGLVSIVCACADTPHFCGASESTVIWSVFYDRILLKYTGRDMRMMAVSSRKTVFGQAVSYTLSKVGKTEMVLKNEL